MEIVGLNQDIETRRQALRSGQPERISRAGATNRGCDWSIKAIVVPFRPSAIDLRAAEPVIKQVQAQNRQLLKSYGRILQLRCASPRGRADWGNEPGTGGRLVRPRPNLETGLYDLWGLLCTYDSIGDNGP